MRAAGRAVAARVSALAVFAGGEHGAVMFWHIAYGVVRGVFDNRVRGRVTGQVWLCGRAEPLELVLVGDAMRDLAGRRLEFFNPLPKPISDELKFLTGVQCVPDVPESERIPLTPEEVLARLERPKDFAEAPMHQANVLYLEWFVPEHGRVTIKSTEFRLVVAPDICWDMTEEQEEEQRRINGGELCALLQWGLDRLRREMGLPDLEDEPRGW